MLILFGITVVRKSTGFNSFNILWVYATEVYVVILIDLVNGRGLLVLIMDLILNKTNFVYRIKLLFRD